MIKCVEILLLFLLNSTSTFLWNSMKQRWQCLERSTSFVPYLLYRDGIVHAEVGQEDGDFFHLTCLTFQQTDTHVVTLQCLLHVTLKQQINIHIFMSTGQKLHTSNNYLSVNVISLNIRLSICKSALVKITKCVLMILLVILCLETELSYLKGEVSCFEPVNSDGKREPVVFKQISLRGGHGQEEHICLKASLWTISVPTIPSWTRHGLPLRHCKYRHMTLVWFLFMICELLLHMSAWCQTQHKCLTQCDVLTVLALHHGLLLQLQLQTAETHQHHFLWHNRQYNV